MRGKTAVSVATACLGLASFVVLSADTAFQSYTAEYEMKRSALRAQLTTTLEYDRDSGVYTYYSEGETKGLASALTSRRPTVHATFVIEGDSVVPRTYDVDSGAKGDKGSESISFRWPDLQADVKSADEEASHEITPGMQSPGSSDFDIRLALMKGQQPGAIAIFNKGRAENHTLEYVGEETLDTAIGELRVIKYVSNRDGSSRSIERWAAPELDYLPVRIAQTRDGKVTYTMTLLSYEEK